MLTLDIAPGRDLARSTSTCRTDMPDQSRQRKGSMDGKEVEVQVPEISTQHVREVNIEN